MLGFEFLRLLFSFLNELVAFVLAHNDFVWAFFFFFVFRQHDIFSSYLFYFCMDSGFACFSFFWIITAPQYLKYHEEIIGDCILAEERK